MNEPTASLSALGGASNEGGSLHRSAVAAWFVAHGLVGRTVHGLPEHLGLPTVVRLETDAPVDDIEVRFDSGATCFVQAKLRPSISSSDFASTVAQWETAVRGGVASPERLDRLVLAVAHVDQRLEHLRSALERRRDPLAGAPTKPERATLDRLEKLLEETNETNRKQLLAMATVLDINCTVGTAPAKVTAEEMLDGAVVQRGQGRRAFDSLTLIAQERAANRSGHVIDDWLELLAGRGGLTLVRAVNQSRAARCLARADALHAYRQALIVAGSNLDLRGLGIDAPPFMLPVDCTSLHVTDGPSEAIGRSDDEAILWALRRRGRVLLTGLPGVGKTTALRQVAAHLAQQTSEPLPMFVSLQSLVQVDYPDVLEAIIAQAASIAPMSDRSLVREEMRHCLSAGDALLILDALDECRGSRHHVLTKVQRFSNEVHAGCEIVLSTRDSAYASAQTLGWPALRLLKPRNLSRALDTCCRAIAQHKQVSTEALERWVHERLEWVHSIAQTEPVVAETPLLPMLLLALATERDKNTLPRKRAHILSAVITDTVRRLEFSQRRDQRFQLAGLTGQAAQGASIRAFDRVAHRLSSSGSAPAIEIEADLAELLRTEYGLAVGIARAGAIDLRHFWDEAGIFITNSDETVTPRVRVLADIGEARFIASLSPKEQHELVEVLSRNSDSHEALALAASLSVVCADSLCDLSRHDVQTALLAARAVRLGATPDPSRFVSLVSALVDHLSSEAKLEVARALSRLHVQEHQQLQVLASIESTLPPDRYALVRAAALANWGRRDDQAVEACVQVLSIEMERVDRGRFGIDPQLSETKAAAARFLLAEHPEYAELVLKASKRFPIRAASEIHALLREQGHGALVEQFHAELASRFTRHSDLGFESYTATWSDFLRLIASTEHCELSRQQRRRLSEMGNLVATLGLADEYPGALELALRHSPAELAELTAIGATLSGVDPRVLSTEAAILLTTEGADDDGTPYLFFDRAVRPWTLDQWQAAGDLDATRVRLCELLKCAPLVARVAAQALLSCPDKLGLALALEPLLPELPVRQRRFGAVLLGACDPRPAALQRWSAVSDPIVRAGAAFVAASNFADGTGGLEALRTPLLDPDLSVRDEVLEVLQGKVVPPELRLLITQSLEASAEGWTCLQDGERCEATAKGCSRSHGAPQVNELATRLLSGDMC